MRRGFTLIEMVVTIGITVVLAGVLLAYNRSSERQLSLTVSQARLVGALSRAKSFSLQKYTGGLATSTACAFGVRIDSSVVPAKAIIFQDLPAPGERCLLDDGTPSYSLSYDGPDETVEVTVFDSHILIGRPGDPGDVVFEAPYLVTYLDGVSSRTATFTVRSPGIPGEKEVIVGPGGDISAP